MQISSDIIEHTYYIVAYGVVSRESQMENESIRRPEESVTELLFGAILLAGFSTDVLFRGFSGGFLLGHDSFPGCINQILAEKSLFIFA